MKLRVIALSIAVLALVVSFAASSAPASAQTVCSERARLMLVVSHDGQVHTTSDLVPPAGFQFLLFDGQETTNGQVSVVRAFPPGRVLSHASYQGSYWAGCGDRVSLAKEFATAKARRNPWLSVRALVGYRYFRFWPWVYWQEVWRTAW